MDIKRCTAKYDSSRDNEICVNPPKISGNYYKMKDTLQFIVSSIVDNAEAVHIDEQETDDITNLIITVDKEDMGKIIGKEGKVIRSIRNIMKIKAIKNNKRINISIADSDKK